MFSPLLSSLQAAAAAGFVVSRIFISILSQTRELTKATLPSL